MGIINKILSAFTKKESNYLPKNLGSDKPMEERLSELGIFEYHEDGFSIKYGNLNKRLKWNDISVRPGSCPETFPTFRVLWADPGIMEINIPIFDRSKLQTSMK